MLRRAAGAVMSALRGGGARWSPAARLDGALEELANAEARARAAAEALAAAAAPPPPPPAAPPQLLSSRPPRGARGVPPSPPPPQAPAASGADAALLAAVARGDADLAASLDGAALGAIAGALQEGRLVPRDEARATRLWLLAARKGHRASAFAVALCALEGVGAIPRDWAAAESLLERLAGEGGEPWAAFALSALLLRRVAEADGGYKGRGGGGSGVPDPAGLFLNVGALTPAQRAHSLAERALALLRAAAASRRVPPAHLNLANCLFFGVGTPGGVADAAGGAAALREGAAAGDALAAATLAARLDAGAGCVPVDGAEAARHWRAAALGGLAVAMHNVGVGYGWPRGGGARDVPAALTWFRRAAAAGYAQSNVNLGLLLEAGDPGSALAPDLAGAEGAYAAAEAALAGAPAATAACGGAGANTLPLARVRARLEAVRAARAEGRNSVDATHGEPLAFVPFDSEAERDAALAELQRLARPGRGTTPEALLEVLKKRFPGA
jgi:TPR repeat protein